MKKRIYEDDDFMYPFIHEEEDGNLRMIQDSDLSAMEDATKFLDKIFNFGGDDD